MFKKMRYGIVILAAAVILTIVLAVTQNRKSSKEMSLAADESFRVQDISAEMMGNPQEEAIVSESFKAVVVSGKMTGAADDTGFGENTYAEEEMTTLSETVPATEEETPEAAGEAEMAAEAGTEQASENVQPAEVGAVCCGSPDMQAEESQEVSEDTESEGGLRAYFEDKLVIDPEKVSLYLNVREEPDEEGKILSVLYPSDICTVIGTDGDWYMIQCEGYVGYVSRKLVLTGEKAYEALRHNVAYAAMAKEDSVFLYNRPDTSSDVILAAAKSEFYRVVGEEGQFYEVSVISPLYETLYVQEKDVLLFYLFLGPGNDNELDEEKEAYFEQLNIGDNLKKAMGIQLEAERERASYESEEERLRESSIAEELAYEQWLKDEAARKVGEAAGNAAGGSTPETQAPAEQPRHEEKTDPFLEAKRTGQKQYLGMFTITGYCHCRECCGVWGSNDPNYSAHGSSGMLLQEDYTVAVDVNQIPYGTRLLINGKEYIAADTGVGPNHIDIYHRLHSDAEKVGMNLAEVYILP